MKSEIFVNGKENVNMYVCMPETFNWVKSKKQSLFTIKVMAKHILLVLQELAINLNIGSNVLIEFYIHTHR